jgi:endonuclease YncB( thermonuclease family)
MWHRDDRAGEGTGAPLVGRPRGAAGRKLQADGIVWEGQVLLLGAEVDLAARVIVTQHRLAFSRGGAIILDVPRAWLHPSPVVRSDGSLLLSITADGDVEADLIAVRMRDGHPATFHLLDLLGGATGDQLPDPKETRAYERRMSPVLPPLPEPGLSTPSGFAPRAARQRGDTAPLPISPHDPFAALPAETPAPFDALTDPVVRPAPPPAAIGRDRDWNLQPIRGMVPQSTRRRRGWALRLGSILFLLAAAYVGIARIPSHPINQTTAPGLPAATGRPGHGTVPQVAQVMAPTATTGIVSPGLAAERTALALGVGGPDRTATAALLPFPPPTNNPPTPTPTPKSDSSRPSAAAGIGKTTPAMPTATSDSTVPASTAAPTPPADQAPLPTPVASVAAATAPPPTVPSTTEAPSAAPIPSPTSPSTSVPTAGPRSSASATTSGGAVPPTQEPSVALGELPDQTLVSGQFRFTINVAKRGATLPDFGLADTGQGDWVALIVTVENVSDKAANLTMADVTLRPGATSKPVALDTGTDVIAGIVGLDPAFGSTDVVPLAPAQERRLALVYPVPSKTKRLTLLVGPTALDLGPAIDHSGSVADVSDAPADPKLVQATVSEVVDGGRINVAIGGAEVKVRYIGIDVPSAGDCYAAEAKSANAKLVAGQTVWLERERTDADISGQWLRDVWIAGPNGTRVLVAARLVEQGAVTARSVDPNIRYAGWLAASAATAKTASSGRWSACQTPAASAPGDPVAVTSRAFSGTPWWSWSVLPTR